MRPASDYAGNEPRVFFLQKEMVRPFQADEALGVLGRLEQRAGVLDANHGVGR